jgi:hypothetical protein
MLQHLDGWMDQGNIMEFNHGEMMIKSLAIVVACHH